MLDIDASVIFQMIGFFALLFVMNRFLYRPLVQILKDREEKIDGSLKAAKKIDRDVQEGLISYEKRLKEAIVKGTELKNKFKQEGISREKEVLDAARASASAGLGRMQTEIEKSKTQTLAAFRVETKAISKDIAEKILDRKVIVTLLAFILPLIPAIVFASTGGGEHGGAEAHESMFNREFLWKVVNFAILVVALVVVWKKILKGLLEKRGADIKKAIEDARVAKEAADRKAAEYNSKLAMLEGRINEIHKELEAEGEAEKKRIIAEAEAASVKLKEQARSAAEAELKKAKIEIREEVARLAVTMAEEILKKELSPADQEKLVKGYLTNLRLN